MSTQSWLREIDQLLSEMGVTYRFEYTKRHGKLLVSKDGKQGVVTISMSPSDHKSLRNVRTIVRRELGLVQKTQLG
jgi:hypothetical protein